MLTTDRSLEARKIEAKGAKLWTDDDIAKLSKAYAYSSGVAALEGVWSRILMAQRYNAQQEEILKANFAVLEGRIEKLEKKEKTK